jgi:hypothetical protein
MMRHKVTMPHCLLYEPQESNAGGEADFLTKLKSSECEPQESNAGGEADFLTKLKSSECGESK